MKLKEIHKILCKELACLEFTGAVSVAVTHVYDVYHLQHMSVSSILVIYVLNVVLIKLTLTCVK